MLDTAWVRADLFFLEIAPHLDRSDWRSLRELDLLVAAQARVRDAVAAAQRGRSVANVITAPGSMEPCRTGLAASCGPAILLCMSEPMYRQIADDLRHQIESGALASGQQLKSEVELREEYGAAGVVSRNTVRDAIKLLVARGLVETRPGQGTFVMRKVQPFVTTLTGDPEGGGAGEGDGVQIRDSAQWTNPRGDTPSGRGPGRLRSSCFTATARGGPQVISRHQERKIDGTPWSLQTTFYPMEFVTRGATQLLMAENFKEGMVKTLEANLGIKQVGWRDTIIARPPDGYERAFFGLSDKGLVAIIEFRRTSYDENGKPIRFTVTVFPPTVTCSRWKRAAFRRRHDGTDVPGCIPKADLPGAAPGRALPGAAEAPRRSLSRTWRAT